MLARTTALLVLTLTSVALAAGSAQAAAVDYGGGRLAQLAGKGYDPEVGLSLHQLANGGVRYRVISTVHCSKGVDFEFKEAGIGKLTGTTFTAFSRRRLTEFPKVRVVVSYRIELQVSDAGATGNLHVDATRTYKGRTRPCNAHPDRDLQLTASRASVGPPAAPAPNAAYAGLLDQDQGMPRPSISLLANRTGKQLAARWQVHLRCSDGKGEIDTNISPRAALSGNRYVKRERYSVHYLHDQVGTFTASIDARVRADGVTGTVRLRVVFRTHGHTDVSCDSRPQHFNALPLPVA